LPTAQTVLDRLRALSDPKAVEGMARFGINPKNTYGVSIPVLRSMAKEIGTDHGLAQQLWSSGFHEAKILASMVDDAQAVTERQMERWVSEFDSWDVCDQCCGNLFDRSAFASQKALEWSGRDEEFIKRAGFVLMAALAVHSRTLSDRDFSNFLPVIYSHATDDRNFVRKAVNWALRQIGKRNAKLNKAAVRTAKRIRRIDSKTARWIASDALRELTSVAVQKKLQSHEN
jgi:3-methyladenine DNA glycosylase AlkD